MFLITDTSLIKYPYYPPRVPLTLSHSVSLSLTLFLSLSVSISHSLFLFLSLFLSTYPQCTTHHHMIRYSTTPHHTTQPFCTNYRYTLHYIKSRISRRLLHVAVLSLELDHQWKDTGDSPQATRWNSSIMLKWLLLLWVYVARTNLLCSVSTFIDLITFMFISPNININILSLLSYILIVLIFFYTLMAYFFVFYCIHVIVSKTKSRYMR